MIQEYLHKLLTPEQIDKLIDANVSESELRKYLAEQSFEAFIQLYFGDVFYLPLVPFQLEIIQDCQDIINRLRNDEHGVKLARCYPRGHGKSTFYAHLLPLYCFLYNISSLTILVGNTHDAGKRLLKTIKHYCENNEIIIEDFGNIKGQQWGLERIETKRGAAIQAFGIDTGSIRGINSPTRPRLVICDDLDDDAAVRSAATLDSMRETLDKAILQVGDSVGFTTSFVVCGTLLRKTSLLQHVMDKPGFHTRIASAVLQFSDSVLWEEWKQAILQMNRAGLDILDPRNDVFYQINKEALLVGTQVLWDRPDIYREAMLVMLDSERTFYSEWQNVPSESSVSLGTLRFTALPENETEYYLLAALDPTTTAGKHSDLAAYVEVLFHPQRKELIVSYVNARQRNYQQTIEEVAERVKRRGKRFDGFWVETNTATIRDLLQERFTQEQLPILAVGLWNKLPKDDRISALSEYIHRGQLLFADTLAADILMDIEMWPYGHKHDDVLDAISMIVLELRKKGLINLLPFEGTQF